MTLAQDLGTLSTNGNLRTVWPDEAADFTPWLAENIGLLGTAIGGIEIEITGREVPVGGFSLDLLGREVGTDRIVVIENQLDRTDHRHLGQLLTYAAGLDAGVIVWVSQDVRDEHREAIHWLNSQTHEEIGFFAVEVELLQIDDSLPAARFSVVAQPSQFQREIVRGARPERSDRALAYQEFFEDLFQRLESSRPGFATSIRRIGLQNGKTSSVAGLRSGFRMGVWFSGREKFWVELWIQPGEREENKSAFDQLHEQKDAVEAELGGSLLWERKDTTKGSRITWRRPGTIDSSSEELNDLKQWAVELLPKFRDVFAPRIQALDLESPATPEVFEETTT